MISEGKHEENSVIIKKIIEGNITGYLTKKYSLNSEGANMQNSIKDLDDEIKSNYESMSEDEFERRYALSDEKNNGLLYILAICFNEL